MVEGGLTDLLRATLLTTVLAREAALALDNNSWLGSCLNFGFI